MARFGFPTLAEIGADGNWCDTNYADPWDPNDPNTYGFNRETESEKLVRKWAIVICGIIYLAGGWYVLVPVIGWIFNLRK